MPKEREELNGSKLVDSASPVVPHLCAVSWVEIKLVLGMCSTKPVTEVVDEDARDGKSAQHVALGAREKLVAFEEFHCNAVLIAF